VTCARQGRGHQIARNPCPALHHHVLQTWCPLPSLGDLVAPQTKELHECEVRAGKIK
jgi:hypothetical protein